MKILKHAVLENSHLYPSIRFNGISRRIPNWLQVLRSLWHFLKGQRPTETPKDGVLEGSKWHEMPILFTFIDDVVDDSLEDWLEPCPGLWEIMPDNKNPSYTSPLAYSNLRFENLSLILNRKSHTAIGARKRPPRVESRKNTTESWTTCSLQHDKGASRAILAVATRIQKKHLTLWHSMVGRCYSFETEIPLVAVVHSWSADIDGWWIHLRCSQESGSGGIFGVFLWASKPESWCDSGG